MDAPTITAAALDVLDEVGLDKLSMRLIGARLGVRAGGLYYHLPDKAALLRSMANAVCEQALADFDAQPPFGGWRTDAARLCGCVRQALRRHRDAARVLAAGPLNGSLGALALMDRLIALLEQGSAPDADARAASVAADTLMAYVTGFVLQEQTESSAVPFAAPLDELRERFPRVFGAAGQSEDETFGIALDTILDGYAHRAMTPARS